MLLAGIFFALLALIRVDASVNGIIDTTGKDKMKLMSAFTSGFVKLQPDDLDSLYYATKGYTMMKSTWVRVFELDGCHHLKTYYKADTAPEAQFHALNAYATLKCAGKLQTDATITALKAALDKGASTADIRFAMETLQYLKQSIPNPAKIATTIQAKLKEDDSLVSLGHALHAAAMLGTHGKFINDRVEDIVVQADEVDSKMLQFEGGLSVTSLLLTGLYSIQTTKPFTQEQVDKFANYLLTRRSVQTAKGAVALLEAAESLSKNNPPVCITLVSNTPVSLDKPELKIRISDLMGNPLKPQPTPVVAQSATRVTDDVVVLSKQPLSPGTLSTEFILPMKLEPGQYKVALSAGQHSAVLMTRVVGPIKIESIELGVEVIDGSQAAKLSMIQYPQKMTTPLQADSNHNLVAKFALPRAVHQAFLRLYTDKKEIIFIGERDASKMYKIVVNLGNELSFSALYKMEIILGDAIMSNPIRWEIGSVDVKLTNSESPVVTRGAKPEIEHMFRQPDKRPPQFVSMLFTALCAAPLLILLIMWGSIGAPLNNFNFYSIPFHLGFTGIMALYTYFWLWGNMFTTCAWLLYIGGFTFIAGNRMLRNIASSGANTSSKK